MPPQLTNHPRLVVLEPEADRGRIVELSGQSVLLGRGVDCDVRFTDEHVSRTHARVERHGAVVYVRDLGSKAGTMVNGVPATGARPLHDGDVITLANVRLRFTADDATSQLDLSPSGYSTSGARFDIDRQHAGSISNVGRDQFMYQQIVQQRDNFLREVAATKTKARWLSWGGLAMLVVGFALFASAIFGFIQDIPGPAASGGLTEPPNLLGEDIAGVPSGILGYALFAVGGLFLVIGIVLHVVATSRRKRVDREYPAPGHFPPYSMNA